MRNRRFSLFEYIVDWFSIESEKLFWLIARLREEQKANTNITALLTKYSEVSTCQEQ
jgi:hypothetical protein